MHSYGTGEAFLFILISYCQGKVEIWIITHIFKGSRKINDTFAEDCHPKWQSFKKSLVLKEISLRYLENPLKEMWDGQQASIHGSWQILSRNRKTMGEQWELTMRKKSQLHQACLCWLPCRVGAQALGAKPLFLGQWFEWRFLEVEAGSFLTQHMEGRKPAWTHSGVGCPEGISEVGANMVTSPHSRRIAKNLQGPVVNGPVMRLPSLRENRFHGQEFLGAAMAVSMGRKGHCRYPLRSQSPQCLEQKGMRLTGCTPL